MMTHRAWWGLALILAGGLVWTGCGGDNEPLDDTPKYKYPDIISFCDAKAKFECTANALERCQTTEDACVVKRRGLCSQSAPAGAKYRPTEAEKCLAAAKLVFQDEKYQAEEKAAVEEACKLLFGGEGGEGAQCSADYHCDLSKELRCVIPTGATQGQCYVPEVKPAGDTCLTPNAVCEDGYFCREGDCVTKRSVGTACGPLQPCKDDLRCVGDETGGVCESKFDTGTECTSDQECLSDMCSLVGSVDKCSTIIFLSPNEPLCEDFR